MNITGSLVRITQSELSDWEEVINLDQHFFPQPWSRASWMEMDPKHHLLVGWKISTKLSGFALFQTIDGDQTAHLLKILLHPSIRRSGNAKVFWDTLAKDLNLMGFSLIYLEVEGTNKQAIGFYQKLGFKTLRTLRGFYTSGSDALAMQLTL